MFFDRLIHKIRRKIERNAEINLYEMAIADNIGEFINIWFDARIAYKFKLSVCINERIFKLNSCKKLFEIDDYVIPREDRMSMVTEIIEKRLRLTDYSNVLFFITEKNDNTVQLAKEFSSNIKNVIIFIAKEELIYQNDFTLRLYNERI